MADRAYTDAEKLAAVERVIELVRVDAAAGEAVPVRHPSNSWHDTYGALRAVAAEIRARMEQSR